MFQCKDIGKSYKRTKFSLTNINLTIERGEILVIAGVNAVGKTTLLRIIASNLLPDYGSIEYPDLIEGSKINFTKLKQKVAYIPQELPQWYGSLKNSLHYEAAMHNIKGKENEAAVDYIIARLGLEKYIDNTWKELSGGFKFRFHLAKALVWNPQLLILDEPLAYLDVNTQITVLNDLRNLVKNGNNPLSIVLSSQHLTAVENVADKFVFLNDQRIIFQGGITDLEQENNNKIFEILTPASIEQLNEIFMDLDCQISQRNRNTYILEVDNSVESQEVFSHLAKLKTEVKQVMDITLSLKKLFL